MTRGARTPDPSASAEGCREDGGSTGQRADRGAEASTFFTGGDLVLGDRSIHDSRRSARAIPPRSVRGGTGAVGQPFVEEGAHVVELVLGDGVGEARVHPASELAVAGQPL